MRWPFPPLFNYQRYSSSLAAEMLALGANASKPHLSFIVALLAIISSVQPIAWSLSLTWLGAITLTSSFGFYFQRRYQHTNTLNLKQLKQAEWLGLFYSAAVGSVWGCSSYLLLPQQFEHNLVITMVYLGVCAGAGSIAIFGLGHLLAGSILGASLFIGRFPVIFPEHWLKLTCFFLIYHSVILRMAWERNENIIANMYLRAEKEHLLQQQQLEVAKTQQANLEKSAFLAAASHDLRQPVHAIMLLGHTLRLQLPAGEASTLVDRILQAGQALATQFNTLMDLSRLEGGAYHIQYEALALDNWLVRLVADRQQLAQERFLRLRLRLDGRLYGQVLIIDSGLLTRILENLLANAIKFAPEGSTILLLARLQQGKLIIAVQDQGPGIAIAQQHTIFKPYVQLHNPTRDRNKGIGLGLSIVKEAAHLLQGELQLLSQPHHGSQFRFILPQPQLKLALRSTQPLLLQPSFAADHLLVLQQRLLLLVEDDIMAAHALQTWAEQWGLMVEHYTNPDQVNQRQGRAPDLVLCDIRLPSTRDGIEHLSDWLEQWPQARGLLISGELLPETHQRAEEEGLILLSKPIDPELLLQTLTQLLATSPLAGGAVT